MTRRRRARHLIVAAVTAVALCTVAGGTAAAWQQPIGQQDTYYMPGPPPGPYTSACVVTTDYSAGSTYASRLYPWDNSVSDCLNGSTAVTYVENGVLRAGPLRTVTKNDLATSVVIADNRSLFGGNYTGCNQNNYCKSWANSWLG